MAISKIILNGVTQIDLTQDTVSANNLISPNTAHGADGEAFTGTASQGITPTGSISITTNGTHDVTNYASVVVSVSGGGGTPSATKHTIHFDFSDETDTDIDVYYDDALLATMIQAYTPKAYGQKTVILAQLDGVAWYEASGDIPLNTELVDYTAVTTGECVDDDGTIISGSSWLCVTDYLPIDSSMTFTFINLSWYGIGFYDSSKTLIAGYISNDIPGATASGNYIHGALTSSIIPSNAAYVVLTGNSSQLSSTYLSLIRTA